MITGGGGKKRAKKRAKKNAAKFFKYLFFLILFKNVAIVVKKRSDVLSDPIIAFKILQTINYDFFKNKLFKCCYHPTSIQQASNKHPNINYNVNNIETFLLDAYL